MIKTVSFVYLSKSALRTISNSRQTVSPPTIESAVTFPLRIWMRSALPLEPPVSAAVPQSQSFDRYQDLHPKPSRFSIRSIPHEWTGSKEPTCEISCGPVLQGWGSVVDEVRCGRFRIRRSSQGRTGDSQDAFEAGVTLKASGDEEEDELLKF
jgi:hypothetical protein